MKQLAVMNKKIDKYGRYIEELEKDVAILKKDSHPPILGRMIIRKLLND